MIPDCDLLRQYAAEGAEPAFAELVRRHLDLVYSAALRVVNGDSHLAEDIAQTVFTDLARKSAALARHPTLAGWLHTSARYAAARAARSRQRRQIREHEFSAMSDSNPPDLPWEELRPVVDEAVGRLPARERDAVLLRYFENKSHREIGALLGVNENAAQKRVHRALEKLRRHFARRGLTASSAVLAAALAAHGVQAAPLALAENVLGAVRAGGATGGTRTGSLREWIQRSPKSALATAAFATLLTLPPLYQFTQNLGLRAELDSARAANPAAAETTTAGAPVRSPTDTEIDAAIRAASSHSFVDLFHAATAEWAGFLSKTPLADFPRVLARLDQVSPEFEPDTPDTLYKMTLAVWAGDDPAAEQAYLQSLLPGTSSDAKLLAMIRLHAADDPAQALGWANQIHKIIVRAAAWAIVIDAMAEKDPAATLAAVTQSKATGDLLNQALQGVFSAWAERDPAAAEARAATPPPGVSRLALENVVADAAGRKDPPSALAWARSLPNPLEAAVLEDEILISWTVQDPPAALAWVQALPASSEKQHAFGAVVKKWAVNDPAGAAALVWQAAPASPNQELLRQIIKIWASQNPAAAASYLANLPSGNLHDNLLDVVLAAWTRQDAGAVAAYTAKLPSGKPRNSYFLSSIDSWATDDPAAAAAFAAALAPGGLKKAAIESVAEAWSKSGDHTGAPEAWAATLADPALRQVAADYLHLGVAANDPLNAGPWLQSLPPGPEREDVVRDFIDDVVDGPHPEAAAPWADTLASARRRNRAIENVADAWADQDPAAAMAWLANTSLPDAQKQALLQQFQKTAAPAPP